MRLGRALLLALLIVASAAPAAEAVTITVDTTDDSLAADGHCSLREAAQAVNDHTRHDACPAGDGVDTIVLPAGTIRLAIPGRNEDNSATGDIDFRGGNGTLRLRGQGMNATTIDAAGLDRAIQTDGPLLALEDLTITGGDGSNRGGGVYNNDGGLELTRVAIVHNRAAGAPGPSQSGGDGGGLYHDGGSATIVDSVIADNSTGDGGDGADETGSVAAAGSTGGTGEGVFGGGGGSGGGLFLHANAVTIVNSRITGNRTGNGGNAGAGVGGPGSVAFGGTASNGGAGTGGDGGRGGFGGGVFAYSDFNRGSVSITHTAISGNVTGDGGSGGAGTGGAGGAGSPPGAGGAGQGGPGGPAGEGGGLYSGSSLVLKASTIAGNQTGSGGAGGSATGGDAPGGNPGGGQAAGGTGGQAGNGAGVSQTYYSSVAGSTIDGNRTGVGGTGGSATGGLIITGGPRVVAGVVGGAGGPGAYGGGFATSVLTYSAAKSADFDFTDITDNFLGAAGPGGTASAGGAQGSVGAGNNGGAIATTKVDVDVKRSIIRGNSELECKGDGVGTFNTSDPLAALGLAPADGSCPGLNADPVLGPLQDNGGPVTSRAPSPLGPAAGRAGDCGSGQEDTRGVVRSNPCEAGSYELAPPTATTGDAVAATATVAGTVNTSGPAGTAHFDFGTSDQYGRSTGDQALGVSSADRGVSATLPTFPAGTTIHYRVVAVTSDGTTAGADRAFVVPAVQQTPPGGGADKVAPLLKSLKLSAKKFKLGKKVTISFSTSEAAKYKLAFAQVLPGKKVKKKGKTTCVKAHGKVAKKSRCNYYKGYGALSGTAKPGANKVAFKGKVGKKKLKRGSYRLTLTAVDGAGNKSKAVTAKFSVTK